MSDHITLRGNEPDLDAITERAEHWLSYKPTHHIAAALAADVLALVGRVRDLEAELDRTLTSLQHTFGREEKNRARIAQLEAERDAAAKERDEWKATRIAEIRGMSAGQGDTP